MREHKEKCCTVFEDFVRRYFDGKHFDFLLLENHGISRSLSRTMIVLLLIDWKGLDS